MKRNFLNFFFTATNCGLQSWSWCWNYFRCVSNEAACVSYNLLIWRDNFKFSRQNMFCALTIIFPFARIPLVLDEKISQTFLVPIKNEFI